MPNVLHISTECYPAAKAGGMGDVVGTLPKYLSNAGVPASVVIPKYETKWLKKQKFETIKKGNFTMDHETIDYTIQRVLNDDALGFPLYVIDIPGKFDRENIYLDTDGGGYKDEAQRYMSFQIAVMEWLVSIPKHFQLIHCHDHMTAMITFLMKYGKKYQEKLKDVPSFFTIHNGQYRGVRDWQYNRLIPEYDPPARGLLDWDGNINHLALAIKCAWKVTTVSPTYMQELIVDSDSLIPLYQTEIDKTTGILNGIDPDVWNPATDKYLTVKLGTKWEIFKSKNKAALIKQTSLKSRKPLIGYIGRLANQKGVDVLVEGIENTLSKAAPARFIILGTGDKKLEQKIYNLAEKYPDSVAPIISYDEGLAHQIYAGCDFLIMPSRFEPCGLNQMFSMRYGTIPIVHSVGGLKDTVPDIDDDGTGIAFENLNAESIEQAINKAATLYKNKSAKKKLLEKITAIDFSWDNSAKKYIEQYNQILKS